MPSTQHRSIDPQSSKTLLRPKGESHTHTEPGVDTQLHRHRLTSVLISDDKIDAAPLNSPCVNTDQPLCAIKRPLQAFVTALQSPQCNWNCATHPCGCAARKVKEVRKQSPSAAVMRCGLDGSRSEDGFRTIFSKRELLLAKLKEDMNKKD